MEKIRSKSFEESQNNADRLGKDVESYLENFENVEFLAQSQSQNDRFITLVITFRGILKNPPE